MHSDMSQKTKKEVIARLRCFYAKAGPNYERQLLDQAIKLFDYHRKAAVFTGTMAKFTSSIV